MNRQLGIDDKVFVLVDSVLLTGLGRIALMPALVLAAKVCPEVEPSPRIGLCIPSLIASRLLSWPAVLTMPPLPFYVRNQGTHVADQQFQGEGKALFAHQAALMGHVIDVASAVLCREWRPPSMLL